MFESVDTTLQFLENTNDINKQRANIVVTVKEKGIPYLSVCLQDVGLCVYSIICVRCVLCFCISVCVQCYAFL